MDKGRNVPFPKTSDLGIAKNYWGITLTSIAAKIYNVLLLNSVEPKIEKILRKNQNGFRRNRSTTSEILTIRRILGVRAKKHRSVTILCRLLPGIWLHTQREYGANTSRLRSLSQETVAAIMILYKNTKVKDYSLDGDTDFFDIVVGIL